MDTIECIKGRRSVRNYTNQDIENYLVRQLIEDAIWAPSGKNGQPWKFKIIIDKNLIDNISNLLTHSKWIKNAPCFVFVFLDKDRSYDYIKDVQSCGALIQTMLLSAQSHGISSCWIGEILVESKTVIQLLNLYDFNIELMALVTLGYSMQKPNKIKEKNIEEFIL